MDIPESLKRAPREQIQPAAAELLSYADVMQRLEELAALHDSTQLDVVGESRSGRQIPLISITKSGDDAARERSQKTAASLAQPKVSHTHVDAFPLGRDLEVQVPEEFRVPILFLSSNFGMEAAQVEALVTLAELLATDTSAETTAALEKLIVLIVPMINPDGRELAIRHWRHRPLSPAWDAQGNIFGIEVTREYLHLIEPETRALAQIVKRWHPFLLWEVHEDGIGLGWTHPEVCLCPPTSPRGRTGVDSPTAPSADDPRLYIEQQRYGAAIAAAWSKLGYRYLHDPNGEHGWPRYPVTGYEQLAPVPETRFTQSMLLRGVAAFITESCRVPGSQTWADRVEQKVSAGAAVVSEAGRSRQALIDLVADVARRSSTGTPEYYLLPHDQDPSVLGRTLTVLLDQEIKVYRSPSREAYAVPLTQPLRPTIEVLLSLAHGRHQSLCATLGLRVIPSRALSDSEKTAWQSANLQPVLSSSDADPPAADFVPGHHYAVQNNPDAVSFVNRLLRIPDAEVRWRTSEEGTGSFLFCAPTRSIGMSDLTRRLRLNVTPASERSFAEGRPLRPARVGLYDGPGCLENRFNGSLLRRYLSEWGFGTRLLGPADIATPTYTDLDIVIIPAGKAEAIFEGRHVDTVWTKSPWQLDEDPHPIPAEAWTSLHSWVKDGGTFIGIDAGGGLLACRDQLGLLDATGNAGNLGSGLVELRLTEPSHVIFDGINGSWGEDGAWRDRLIHAMYTSHPHVGLDGGCLFQPGPETQALATFEQSLPLEGIPHLADIDAFGGPGNAAAIAGASVGAGRVFIFGIEPTYRSTFLNTGRLISNLIWSAT